MEHWPNINYFLFFDSAAVSFNLQLTFYKEVTGLLIYKQTEQCPLAF